MLPTSSSSSMVLLFHVMEHSLASSSHNNSRSDRKIRRRRFDFFCSRITKLNEPRERGDCDEQNWSKYVFIVALPPEYVPRVQSPTGPSRHCVHSADSRARSPAPTTVRRLVARVITGCDDNGTDFAASLRLFGRRITMASTARLWE